MAREHILIKLYGHLWPVRSHEGETLMHCLSALMPPCDVTGADELLSLTNDLLRVSFEGMYFPIDELMSALMPFLHSESQGKIDYIDMEAWRLTRYTIQGQHIDSSCVCLNTVLDYSGH